VIWDEKNECMAPERRTQLQVERLRRTVKWVSERVPHYHKALKEAGIAAQDIKSLDDLRALPFTTKDDLRDNYPFGLFAVPLEEVVRIHASSGTTGKPTVVGYTREDIELWAQTIARTIGCGGGTPKDVMQVAYGYGLFTGGLGLHYGGEKMGCTVVPTSAGNSKRQVMLMQDFGCTILACTPSYSLYLAEVAEDMGVDIKSLRLRVGLFGAEPWTDSMRNEIEARLDIIAIDIYGLSEVIGPGVASECEEKHGLHVFEDHFIPEVINPATGEVLPDGQEGELVFTSVTKKAFPVLRYRTRDLSKLMREPCPCGRTLIRMARITGRTDDMIVVRGTNVFPSQIETVLMEVEETAPHYRLIVDKRGALDELTVEIEVNERIFSDAVRHLEELEHKIQRELEAVLGITAVIKLVEPRSIQRSEGKAQRVIDKRKTQ
jgi:phenylacetate-CoA ligase